MHPLSSLSKGFAFCIAVSSLVAAEPLRYRQRPAEVVEVIHVKRQETTSTSTCTDAAALCILNDALATFPSSILAKLSTTTSTTSSQSSSTDTPTTTSSSQAKGGIIQVTVVQPSLCSTSALQFSSAYSVPTGIIQIHAGSPNQGWGVEGSIWNITANDGVELNDFHVPCQGSACTGITGNKEEDGSIVKNPDGSWTMNVTANMQPSVALFGNASGGNPSDGTFDLTVTSTPPCALPVFQNCSGRRFDPTANQWDAYSTGPFLESYLAKNNINSLSGLLAKASNDFLPTTDAQRLICNPDAGQNYDCVYPSQTQCDSTSPDATAGFLIVAAVVRMSQMLSLLYTTIERAQADMSGYITQIVTKFFQPQAEQEWQAIVTAVSSIVGLFTFVAILIDGFTAFTATPALVAAVVGIQSALGAAANFKNGFEKQKPDATYLAIDGNYTQSVIDYCRSLEEVVNNVWDNTELTQAGIKTALASGEWLEVGNPYNVSGITEDSRDWLDNLLVTSYINRVMSDADAYIAFLPYQKYVYSGVYGRTEIIDFNQDLCATHWANDPGWSYYATCDVPMGLTNGMAVVTRPSSEGKGSKTWTSGVEWVWASYTWDAHAMVASVLGGYAEHGFGYNLTNINFANILNKGAGEAIDSWKTLPLSTPGLFNLPVCVMTNMMDIPGGGTPATDWGRDAVFNPDPYSCVGSNYTLSGAKFCDNVSPAIKKSINCPGSTTT